MEFSDDQARLLRHLVTEAVLRRQHTGQPIPDRVRALLFYMSAGGASADHQQTTGDDLVGTNDTAQILECSTRHVRRLAADLDGRNVAGRLLFDRRTVSAYAEARRSR